LPCRKERTGDHGLGEVRDLSIVMIPYIQEREAEVYLAEVDVAGKTPKEIALEAVEAFASEDETDDLAAHCEEWHATRVLVPSGVPEHQFAAYTIESVLSDSPLEEAM